MAMPWTHLVTKELPTAAAFGEGFNSPLLASLVLITGLLGTFTANAGQTFGKFNVSHDYPPVG